ncbi:amino acid ABC transporter substrate-binding protein [Clostridium sp. D33t1_170424_F3]|uniref:amino acid ABC transporter substrate-binding protein n=1 Tax=Clostridium sp. D33t1_170424_F3 TaxID=2787099 RepID=UPI002570047F|nr:amino acid ABC transporter substrate-binding protein [Clostridium sp. D33t1_170424_F3]
MKKVWALLLTAILVIGCVGCGSPNAGNGGDAAGLNNNSQEMASGMDGEADASWDKVEQAGKLILGLDDAFPPMGFVDTQTGELVGFDIDVAREVCNHLGIELETQPINWDNKSAELNNGNVDCLWNGFSKTEERDREFNLSIPYMKNNQIVLVKSDSAYKGLKDLEGKTVGVQADSSAEVALNDNPDFKNTLKDIVQIDDYSKAVLEIQNGTIDAIAIDEVVARYYLTNNPGAYVVLQNEDGTDASLAQEDYVIGFRKADNALKEKVEGALKEMAADGTIKEISEKWFSEDVTTVPAE